MEQGSRDFQSISRIWRLPTNFKQLRINRLQARPWNSLGASWVNLWLGWAQFGHTMCLRAEASQTSDPTKSDESKMDSVEDEESASPLLLCEMARWINRWRNFLLPLDTRWIPAERQRPPCPAKTYNRSHTSRHNVLLSETFLPKPS